MTMLLRSMLVVSISVLTLSACQTSDLSKQTSQTIKISNITVNLDSDGDGVLDAIDECPETPPNVVVDAKGCEIIIEGGEALEMELHGFFAPLSSRLINTYDKEFKKIEEKLNEYPDANVFIFGHLSSNELALSKGNDNLSRQRALTIKNRLITEHYIAPDRITTYDCLDRYPSTNIDDNPEQIESKDRRVVFKASRQVKDLSNLKYAGDRESYGKYAKHCEPFE